MKSRTEKLPAGRSYPITLSMLAPAIEQGGLRLPIQLTRWNRFDHAFQADFLPEGWPKQAGHELFWLHCRAVRSDRAAEARRLAEQEIIPAFIAWAQAIEALDPNSPIRREKQSFKWSLIGFETAPA